MGDILFLAHRIPYPPDRGDKMRGFHIVRHLGRRARVHVAAFAEDARDEHYAGALRGYVESVTVVRRTKSNLRAAAEALVGNRPVSLSAFHHPALKRAVGRIVADHPIDAAYAFSGQMAQYLPTGPVRAIMDFVDLDSAKFAAYADAARGPVAWMHAREARMLGAFERSVAARADASLFVSAAEAELFRARSPDGRVAVLENGIDTRFYDPAAGFPAVGEAGPLLVFTGQMDYRPNVEAVAWFADEVLPRLRERHPAARFAIVGRKPTEAVRSLGERADVIVTGEVADVRGWLAAAAVSVAPLRLARGIQNKVLEAMAMARPVVASEPAAEGIDHAGTIRVAGTAAAMVGEIDTLLADRDAADRLGTAARNRVRGRYGWDACMAPLDALMSWRPEASAA
ncbi:TIGR03087 family PEP-CTERM/XrtA system glycosyltransferase [Stakelama saccharophila]|uniref:TIGR03087 family PEP-CTERM/XrtA system glycosyltransferase n=1 Tax=Stakelama saccharophila TaxID=3075605 RepID=A0ABZ0B864_9SPHN|nr:TIGR03087 family PEP-CTERM/XrtA system glycosyltransferase [Stakelama sp. W311]WNO52796.1 TIGR03087 family PEP-CTERM/XrtA system glycosyltransferase [Stakelama sp. W311]